jgi:sigma-54-specific transcriptional regulator
MKLTSFAQRPTQAEHAARDAGSGGAAAGRPSVLTLPEPRRQTHSIRASALVFEDPLSRELLAYLERVAPSDATVLIHGETGTGKELVARHVHALSHRRNAPFVAVNCAALNESLLDSELFGHRKGAFTGADRDREGWFETAHRGTLFLDEIGDLPAAAQVKLLRVLQEREVVPVGARTPTSVDFRLIAATNVDLKHAVEAGHFRADLYYRLSVADVRLRPLRERPGDIPPLVEHFLAMYGGRLGHSVPSVSPPAMQRLLSHPWPGNIRELENVLHHTLLVCPGPTIRAQDVYLPERPQSPEAHGASAGGADLQQVIVELLEQGVPDLYAEVEQTVIRTAYEFHRSNQVRTAQALGISRNVLRERLHRLGMLPYAPSRRPET